MSLVIKRTYTAIYTTYEQISQDDFRTIYTSKDFTSMNTIEDIEEWILEKEPQDKLGITGIKIALKEM